MTASDDPHRPHTKTAAMITHAALPRILHSDSSKALAMIIDSLRTIFLCSLKNILMFRIEHFTTLNKHIYV